MKKSLSIVLLGIALIPVMDRGTAPPSAGWGVSVLEVGSSRGAIHEQLALRDSLELMGIPYQATSRIEEAVRRPLMLIGGLMLNTELSPDEREALYKYVERGGVLLATQVQGNRFFPLFGIARATTSRMNFQVRFASTDDPSLRYLNRPEERIISLGNPDLYSETVWSTEYVAIPGADVLARYENGAAAVTRYAYGRGLAYALGLGFKETTLIPQLAQSFEAARRFINWFEPSGDVFRLLLRGLYEDTVHPYLLIHTVPDGRQTALCLSHDVDAQESFQNSVVFARMEAALGVRSTFFVTTKYFQDEADVAYYTPERVEWIRQLAAMGFEVGSHSVSHTWTFHEIPTGSPEVNFQSYDTAHPTVFGEVRVSKELLDRDLQQQTTGFRAGYLRYPHELLGTLEDSGYTFDSSVSAQWVLTNFPHFGFRRRALDSDRSRIVVVPVTLDDSKGELKTREFLTAANQDEALRIWAEVIRANSENNAISCLLIHPTDATYKLETERRLIEALRGEDIWIGEVGALARFWRDRSQLRPVLRVAPGEAVTIVLNLAKNDLPPGQTLVVEKLGSDAAPRILDAEGHTVAARVRLRNGCFFLTLTAPHENGDRPPFR
jgi:peptidoglycan/xylan/chitin deacetylase (PgdA/CDA1 family)